MRITSLDGDFLELRVVGYQFPDSRFSPGDEDANWLVISGDVQRGGESWSFRDPSLLTWEAKELVSWLQRASRSGPEQIDFIEPNISFEVTPNGGDEIVITLTLRGEAAPPSIAPQDRWDRGCAMALRVSRRALTGAAGEWERDLADFPAR